MRALAVRTHSAVVVCPVLCCACHLADNARSHSVSHAAHTLLLFASLSCLYLLSRSHCLRQDNCSYTVHRYADDASTKKLLATLEAEQKEGAAGASGKGTKK